MSLAVAFFTALATVALPPLALAADPDPTLTCPDPIREGESDRVGLRWPGHYMMTPVSFYAHTSGHPADLSHAPVAADPRHVVDTDL